MWTLRFSSIKIFLASLVQQLEGVSLSDGMFCFCFYISWCAEVVIWWFVLPFHLATLSGRASCNVYSVCNRTLPYLWLAKTSQQPISQTTWLKVIPHCNHCNHYLTLAGCLESAVRSPCNFSGSVLPLGYLIACLIPTVRLYVTPRCPKGDWRQDVQKVIDPIH